METIQVCSLCNTGITRGKLALTTKGEVICYECCGIEDKEWILNLPLGGKTSILYWNDRELSNWPGTLKIVPNYKKISKTNWGLTRTDMWFMLEGKTYHAKHIGHNTQICHVQRIKH